MYGFMEYFCSDGQFYPGFSKWINSACWEQSHKSGQSVGNSLPVAAASSRSGCGNRALTWIHWNAGEMRDELQRNVLVPALFLSPGC